MRKLRRIIPVILALLISFSVFTSASAATPQSLRLPAYTQTECEWDESGRLISETAHDVNGEPAINSRGFYKAEYTWDENNNPLTETFTGLNGEPVNADSGYAKAVFAYENNSKGIPHLVSEERYDANGNPASILGSYSSRRDIWENDQIISTSYYDADGNLTQPTGGYARILYTREEDENIIVITQQFEAADGTPLLGAEGGAKVISTYAKGLTAASNARVDSMGLGMMLETQAGGEGTPNAKPETSRGELFNTVVRGEDEDNQLMLLSTEIFGTDGSKTLGAKRWHKEIRSYDEQGNLIRTEFYSADGEPIISATGAASIENEYDELNRVIRIDYLDQENLLIKMLNGYARVT